MTSKRIGIISIIIWSDGKYCTLTVTNGKHFDSGNYEAVPLMTALKFQEAKEKANAIAELIDLNPT